MDMDLQNEGGRVLSLELAELVTDCRVFGSGGVRSYLERGELTSISVKI